MPIRKDIIRLRDRLGWSDYRLAKESGVPYTTVSTFLKGERDAGTEIADKLLHAMQGQKRSR